MSEAASAESAGETKAAPRLAILLAAAMFVFVIDTSFMNVSISAVVRDLDTTVSGVQSAVAIEALVSNSATGSFGLSFGLAFAGAIMLATLSIALTDKADSSQVLPPAEKQQVADVLEDDS